MGKRNEVQAQFDATLVKDFVNFVNRMFGDDALTDIKFIGSTSKPIMQVKIKVKGKEFFGSDARVRTILYTPVELRRVVNDLNLQAAANDVAHVRVARAQAEAEKAAFEATNPEPESMRDQPISDETAEELVQNEPEPEPENDVVLVGEEPTVARTFGDDA